MSLYDLPKQADKVRLAAEADKMGRRLAQEGFISARSDVIESHANQAYRQAMKSNHNAAGEPATLRTVFIETYVQAYFEEIVSLRDQGQL